MAEKVRQRTLVIRQFITETVSGHPEDIAKVTASQFQISRQAACQHVKWLAEHGVLLASGNTAGRKYELLPTGRFSGTFPTKDLKEDRAWREWVAPLLEDAPANVVTICNIAFSELLNNVIDHSESPLVSIDVLCTAATVAVKIRDEGVGIFKKIKDDCGLAEERDAILELGKGKLTTCRAITQEWASTFLRAWSTYSRCRRANYGLPISSQTTTGYWG